MSQQQQTNDNIIHIGDSVLLLNHAIEGFDPNMSNIFSKLLLTSPPSLESLETHLVKIIEEMELTMIQCAETALKLKHPYLIV